MRLLLIIYSGESPERVTELLDHHRVEGYTRLPEARGSGQSGRRLGTRAWPGSSTVFFSIVPAAEEASVVGAIRKQANLLPASERLHVAVMPVDYVV